jgi:hypothetical protein
MRKLILTICLIIAMTSMVSAQDEAAETCDTSSALATITELVADTELEPIEILRAIKAAVDEILLQCDGLMFTSENEGLQPVIGPVEFPEGLYRVTFTTEGYGVVELEFLEGECEPSLYSDTLFINNAGESSDGAQATLNSSGCEVLILLSRTNEPWTLEFEKLR